MLFRLLKHGVLAVAVLLISGFVGSDVFAMEDYSFYEVSLQETDIKVIQEDRKFNAISVQADENTHELMVNFGNGWEEVDIHDHGYGPEALLFTSPTYVVQFKSSEALDFKTHIFFQEFNEIGGIIDTSNLTASTQLTAAPFNVISRSEWGADEMIRYWTPEMEEAAQQNGTSEKTHSDPCAEYDIKFQSELGLSYIKEYSPDGNLLTWPLQYMKTLRKFVIHHTDSEIRDINGDYRMDSLDYKGIVRAIYRYHAISRGWGDIGYNYIIDPLGNIYEGRYGGDKVIGAHAICYNNGTMGISIIGNYQDNEVPEPALQSLISLLARKAKIYRIDPNGSSLMRGKKLPNIIGHRDIGATACPGDKLYALFPKIRDRVALSIRSGTFSEGNLQVENLDYNAQSLTDINGISLKPNERRDITLKFKNTGKKAWDHNTWLHVALNNNSNARVVPAVEDKAFVVADLNERSVAPGQTGSFDIQIEGGYYPGYYSFEVTPVVNGRYKVSRSSIYIGFTVQQPDFSYELVGSDLPASVLFYGQKIRASVELKNTGNITWKNYGDNKITLGTSSPRDRASIFIKNNPARIGYLVESEISPGEIGTFVMDLEVPLDKSGEVIERFTPVIENVGWLDDMALGFKTILKEPVHLARIKKLNQLSELLPGEMRKIELEIENKGDLTWDVDNMRITLLGRGLKVFKNKLIPLEPVAPGEKVKFDFWVQAPYEEGSHGIYLRGLFNKVAIRGGAARYLITTPKPALRAKLIDQGDLYLNMSPGEEKEITVQFKNHGNVIWRNKGAHPITLASSLPRDRLSDLYYEDSWENKYRPAVLNEKVVYPGEIGTFTFKIKPTSKRIYKEPFQLVIENVGWVTMGNVFWYFRVFGNPVSESTSSTNTTEQERVIELINKAPTTTTVTTTSSSQPAPVTVSPAVTEKPFRVRLSYNSSSSKITSNKNYKIVGSAGNTLFTMASGNDTSVTKVGNNIHVQVGNISKGDDIIRFIPDDGGIMEIKSWENQPAWNQSLNDNRFRGIMEVRVVNDKTAYINELPLEDYLKGLGEVSNDALFEKQKTIAVLARTYARFYMQEENRKFPGLPYDGSDDPDIFQKYLGYGLEIRSPNYVGAAGITKDEVVTYNGELVKTPYFNQSDGATKSAEEVWGWTHTPYLKSVADPWCEGLIRNGHGVGLSGYGATKQAEEGKTYDDIIKYYYQGVQVEEL